MVRKFTAALLLTFVLLAIAPAFAQEPTQEPVVETGGETVVVAPEQGGSVTVVQPSQPEPDEANSLQSYINTILAVAAFVASAFVFLDNRKRDQIMGVAEKGEGWTWLLASTYSKIIQTLGGRPDFETSTDPATLAKGLVDRDVNVVISKDVNVDAVFAEYNRLKGR